MSTPSRQINLSTARDIMVRPVVVNPQTEVDKAIGVMLERNISGVPVVDEDNNYLGVFSEKCCLRMLADRDFDLGESGRHPVARDVMQTELFCLQPNQDVFCAIGNLLERRFSGAPVIGGDGTFQGVFSEKTAMRVVVHGAYEQIPTTEVAAFMDQDKGRIIEEDRKVVDIVRSFVDTPYRRLPVLRNDRILGQISRRDVLRKGLVRDAIVRIQTEQQDGEPVVADCMNTDAHTIQGDLDLLAVAQIFLQTPYRRLPVLEGGKLLGQVSRRDVLDAAYRMTAPPKKTDAPPIGLFLSAISEDTRA